ncbi:adenylate/guanylate cyclase domain-containing protein [Hoeflea sp.]|uniref:adenylate/guanylate cyclase domain-containing protein n=1 Tax=Hoeflea sp. TaxID=1940281 RepID=UPI003B02A8EF
MERRLAAILAADVVGYSSLVALDEERAVRAVRAHILAVELDIGLHHGRVVKTTGDGILAEFGSVVDAVSCATMMQVNIAKRNADATEAERMAFRIGVHVGDILILDDDIFGDGVNIAARVEGLAPPGGILVTSRVHEDVGNKLDLTFRDLGEHRLKNIPRPVRLFEVNHEVAVETPVPQERLQPGKPSLAVLPFLNMSDMADNEYFADGLTEDIITALAQVPWMFVIARNSSFTYKGMVVDVRKVGRDLGVAYVLEGSIRQQGNRLRISGQLVDAADGSNIWANKFDGTLEDVFGLQDRIADAVVSAIGTTVQAAEINRVSQKSSLSLTAYDHYLKALAALNRAQIDEAGEYLDKAIEIAPDYAKAMAIRSWCHTLRNTWLIGSEQELERLAGMAIAERALETDNSDIEVSAYAGYTLGFFGADIDRAFSLLAEATDRCPSFAWAWNSRAVLEGIQGDSLRAIEFGRVAQRLSPRDPQMFRTNIAIASGCIKLHRYEEALEEARIGLRLNPNIVVLLCFSIVSLWRMGRKDEASEQARLLMARKPSFRVSPFLEHKGRFRNFRDEVDGERTVYLDVGLPE